MLSLDRSIFIASSCVHDASAVSPCSQSEIKDSCSEQSVTAAPEPALAEGHCTSSCDCLVFLSGFAFPLSGLDLEREGSRNLEYRS